MITGRARDRMEKIFTNIVDLERHLSTRALDKIVSKERRRPGVQEDILAAAYFTSSTDMEEFVRTLQEVNGNGVEPLPPFGWDGLDYLDVLYELGPYSRDSDDEDEGYV